MFDVLWNCWWAKFPRASASDFCATVGPMCLSWICPVPDLATDPCLSDEVRCHVELIKQHLDRFLPQQIAPGSPLVRHHRARESCVRACDNAHVQPRTFKEELVDIEGRVWPGSVPDAVPRPTFHFRGLSCGIPATTEEQCSIRTAAFSCTRDSRALDPGTMRLGGVCVCVCVLQAV